MDLIQLSSSILNTLLYATSYVMSKYIYRIQKHKLSTNDKQQVKQVRYKRRKLKIIIIGLPTLLCFIQNYINLCLRFSNTNTLNVFQCSKQFDTEKIGMGILTSLYMSLLLYIGPVYQEFWNGSLKKKLKKFRFNKFRWDYFTKIVITPLIDELIFRELVNNAINAQYDNNITFLAYSTFLYCFAKTISFRIKYSHISPYELMKSFVLGLYLSYVLVQTKTIATVIINHGLLNFMGRPNFRDLVKGNYSNELRWKIIRYYILGFVCFLIFCILVL